MLVRYKLERKMAKKNEEQAQSSKRGRKPKIRQDLEITTEIENDLKLSSSKTSSNAKESQSYNTSDNRTQLSTRETKESLITNQNKESAKRTREKKESPLANRDGSPRPSREAKGSPKLYKEVKDSPKRQKETKDFSKSNKEFQRTDSSKSNKEHSRSSKESPRTNRESPRSNKESPRSSRDSSRTNRESSGTREEERRSHKVFKESKEISHSSKSGKDDTKRRKHETGENKFTVMKNRDAKEKQKEDYESPRLPRQAKESPKLYSEEKDSTRSDKYSPKEHTEEEVNTIKDVKNLTHTLKDSKNLSQKEKDCDSATKVREYITPAIRIREPKILKDTTKYPETAKPVDPVTEDSIPIATLSQLESKQTKEKNKSQSAEQTETCTGAETDNVQVNKDEALSQTQLYSSDEIVLNEEELLVHNEIEVETIPNPVPDHEVESLSKDEINETSFAVNDRPFRAAAATAQAISEAQQEFMSIEPPPEFKRNSKGKIELLVDKPIKPRKYTKRAKLSGIDPVENGKTKEAYDEETASQCSSNPILQDTSLIEFPSREYDLDEGEENYVDKNLSHLLENIKNQYMGMIKSMQDPAFIKNIEQQIRKEKSRNEQLSKRVDQLESQIETLIQDSLGMLKSGLKELGIDARTPPDFIEKAKGIVCEHNDLQKKKYCLEAEIKQLEEEQNNLLKNKEAELFEKLLKQKSPHRVDLSESELMKVVQREINDCLKPLKSVPNKKNISDVTLTRVDNNINRSRTDKDNSSCVGEVNIEKQSNEKYSLSKAGKKSGSSEQTKQKNENPSLAPKGLEDYESRVKNIITRELADDRRTSPQILTTFNVDMKHLSGTATGLDYNWNEADVNQNTRNNAEMQGLDMRRMPNKGDSREKEIYKEKSNDMHDYKIYKKDNLSLNQITNEHYTVVDHINKEIEKNMRAELLPVRAKDPYPRMSHAMQEDGGPNLTKPISISDGIVKNLSAISTDQFMGLPAEQTLHSQAQASVSRLTQVIEDSVRGSFNSNIPMEGLACPRNGTSPKFQVNNLPRTMDHEYRQGYPLKSSSSCSSTSSFPMSLMQNMEGLASRMETCFDKDISNRRGDTPDVQNCSRPTSRGSKSSLHTPDPTLHLDQEDRKRVASPVGSPVIPAKKQQFDNETKTKEPISNKPKEKIDEARKWQDEISSGFDRLVALASEVDKRRKSIENSPSQNASITSRSNISSNYMGNSQKHPDDKILEREKFKYSQEHCNLVTTMDSQFDLNTDATQEFINNDAVSNITTSANQFAQCQTSKISGPGEKLPERHFKKKYFDQEYQKQQQQQQQQATNDKIVTSPGVRNCTSPSEQQANAQKSTNSEDMHHIQNYAASTVLSHTNYNQTRPQPNHEQPINSGPHVSLENPKQTPNSVNPNASIQSQSQGHPSPSLHKTSSVNFTHSTHPAVINQSSHTSSSTQGGGSQNMQPIHPMTQTNQAAASLGQHINRGHSMAKQTTKYLTQKASHTTEQHYYGESYPRHNMYPPYQQGQIRQDPMMLSSGSQNANFYGSHSYSRQGYPANYRGRAGYMYQPPPNADDMHSFRNPK